MKELTLEQQIKAVELKETEATNLVAMAEMAANSGMDISALASKNFASVTTAKAFLKILNDLRAEKASKEAIAEKLFTNTFARGRKASSPEEKFETEMSRKADKAEENLRKYLAEYYAAKTAQYAEGFIFAEHDMSVINPNDDEKKPYSKRCRGNLVNGYLLQVTEDFESMELASILDQVADLD